jgi:hypothetical protein
MGFIFFDLFSNVGGTGCRRGRTPERPLRQPSKVWLSARPFFVELLVHRAHGRAIPTLAADLPQQRGAARAPVV